jgi:hypothetical protein
MANFRIITISGEATRTLVLSGDADVRVAGHIVPPGVLRARA